MQEIYITHAKRTATGSFLGSLSAVPAPRLGAEIIKAILTESDIEHELIDEIILGQVLTGGSGQNPARQSSIHASMPVELPAMTINKASGSGLKAVALAASAIKAGEGDLIIAGGQENMSLAMHGSYLRGRSKFGDTKLIDFMMYDGLTDVFSDEMMGITAKNMASQFKISREDQAKLALASQIKAAKAQQSGKFKDDIVQLK